MWEIAMTGRGNFQIINTAAVHGWHYNETISYKTFLFKFKVTYLIFELDISGI